MSGFKLEGFGLKEALLVAGGAAGGALLAVALQSMFKENEGQEQEGAYAEADDKKERVTVYCGSSLPTGKHRDAIIGAAEKLGAELARRKVDLVYGGGNIGIMGILARAVDKAGGNVIGVIPKALAAREVSGDMVRRGTEILTDTMHERKQIMARKSRGFIALPGGLGTYEELMEAATWTQLNIHAKAVGLLNVGGFYDGIVAQLQAGVDNGMIRPGMRGILPVSADPADLLDKVLNWKPADGEQLKLDWSAGRFGQPKDWLPSGGAGGDEDKKEGEGAGSEQATGGAAEAGK